MWIARPKSACYEGGGSYFEETGALPLNTAFGIMQDETCMALPFIKTLADHDDDEDDDEEEYIIVLRSLLTHAEYMHPQKVTSLDNWHCYFVDCPLMQGMDFVSKPFKFPELTSGGTTTAVVTRDFSVQGRSFRVSVTRAPPSPNSAVVFHLLTSAALPVHHTLFENLMQTSAQRKACLTQYAVMALLDQIGLTVSATTSNSEDSLHNSTSEEDMAMVQRLTLEHGTRIFQGVGTKQYQVSGWFEMHEEERTAASVSLPLLLKHLHFLQYAFGNGPSQNIQYHIKAPNKYAYMVWVRHLGGFEVFYQVNMNASLAAMQNAFLGGAPLSSSMVTPVRVDHTQSRSVTGKLLQQKMLMDMIQKQLQHLKGGHSVEGGFEKMTEDEFVSHLKSSGLEMLQKQISDVLMDARRLLEHTEAKVVLRSLLLPPRPDDGTNAMIIIQQIKTAGMVFMGIVKDVWENLVEKEESRKGAALIHLLTDDFADNWLVRLKDKEYLPIVINGCLNDDQPYKWWERFMSVSEIVNVKKKAKSAHVINANQNSAYLCASILSYPDQYTPLLSTTTVVDAATISGHVEKACLSDADIGGMKEAYEVLSASSGASILEVLKSNDEARKLYYIRAVAFRMLMMDHHGLDKIKGVI